MKEEKEENLDNPTVYKISHSDIQKTGVTQCQMGKHKFQKLSEDEIYCPVCQSAFIVKNIKDYVATQYKTVRC
jgi:hypothetical protein